MSPVTDDEEISIWDTIGNTIKERLRPNYKGKKEGLRIEVRTGELALVTTNVDKRVLDVSFEVGVHRLIQ